MTIRALIVDDEPLGRSGVSARLKTEPGVEIVGECENGRLAVKAICELAPDLLFLDVQMPGMNGFDVLAEIGDQIPPAVIFVTAYDSYAVRAFDACALDYLLKPIDDERFKTAVLRAQTRLSQNRDQLLSEKIAELLANLRPKPVVANALARFVVKSGGHIFFVKADEIDWIEALGDYVRLHTGAKSHLLRDTLTAVESKLDARFLRIHRSTIVNVDRIKELHPYFNGEYAILLQDGTELKSGRSYRERLRRYFDDPL
jgi:two-component system, LytTR family, response regulator